jgi:hypothetical protein
MLQRTAGLVVEGGGCLPDFDPIEGGSANNYDYVAGDPINGRDLDGQCAQFWQKRCRGKGSWVQKTTKVTDRVDLSVGGCAVACLGVGIQGLSKPYWYHGYGIALQAGANVGLATRTYERRECQAVAVSGSIVDVGIYVQQGQRRNSTLNGKDFEGGWAPGLGAGLTKYYYHASGC